MHQISIKKVLICLVSILIIVTCASCKAEEPYLVKDYLNYLANKSGIANGDDIEDNFTQLCKWKIVLKTDNSLLNDQLDYAFMAKTICNLLQERINPMDALLSMHLIDKKYNESKKVNKQTAQELVDKAVDVINNREFVEKYEYEYITNPKNTKSNLAKGDLFFNNEQNAYYIVSDVNEDSYEFRNASFEEVFSSLDIEDSYVVDFTDAEIIPLNNEQSAYVNNKYNLLASKSHVFNKDGFRVSYSVSTSGIDVHISNKIDKTTLYLDTTINKVKPNFKWTYEKGDLKNCYFNIKFNSSTSLGATIGKYGNYYLKLKDLDSNDFLSSIKSMIIPKTDELEAVIPICQIKTPVPNIPFLYLNMTLGIKLYVSGKVEIVILNNHNVGFEIREGNARFFYDHDDDLDTIMRASTKSAIALNLSLDEANFKLCDIELDGGIKSEVKSTLHLYDSDFNKKEVSSDIELSTLEDISKDNPYVKVCGDVSLYWMIDLICNTSKTQLYKLGFTKTFNILDEDNQIFNNLHHIEDGKFVKACTRKSNKVSSDYGVDITSSDKIVLNTYAEVINIGDSYQIEVLSLPEGYSLSDIRYSSSDSNVAGITAGKLIAKKAGSAKIRVYTSDSRYSSYINVLVSTG